MREVFDPQSVLGNISHLQQVVGVTSDSGLQHAITDISGRVHVIEDYILKYTDPITPLANIPAKPDDLLVSTPT